MDTSFDLNKCLQWALLDGNNKNVDKLTLLKKILSKVESYISEVNNYFAVLMIRYGFHLYNLDSFYQDYNLKTSQLSSISFDERNILMKLLQQWSIIAYYTMDTKPGDIKDFDLLKNIGVRISDYLLSVKGFNDINRQMIRSNMYFYVCQLPVDKRIKIEMETPLLPGSTDQRYRIINPSIISDKDGYVAIYRMINYKHEKGVYSEIVQYDYNIRTRNFLVKLSSELEVISKCEIIDKSGRNILPTRVLGFEDCHLVRLNEDLYFTCTTLGTSPYRCPQISLCKIPKIPVKNTSTDIDKHEVITDLCVINELDDLDNIERYEVVELVPLQGPEPGRVEKNWIPFTSEILEPLSSIQSQQRSSSPGSNVIECDTSDNLHIIYSYDPTVIISPIKKDGIFTGQIREVSRHEPKMNFTDLRGSAGVVPFQFRNMDGYLVVTHEVIFRNEGRIYHHRFVWINLDYKIKAISYPWYLDLNGIEFCRGIVQSHNKQDIIITAGVNDEHACIYVIKTEKVHSFLFKV